MKSKEQFTPSQSIVVDDRPERDASGMPCPCGGYADRVSPTEAERDEYQWCGRPYNCCIRAFVCRVCKKRLIANAAAPEAS